MDLLSDKYHSLSPYNYVANNPIKFVDYDGNDFGIRIENGKLIISQTFIADQSDNKTEESLLEAKRQFESLNGLYELKTDNGVFEISFEFNILKGSGDGSVDYENAKADNETNYLDIREQDPERLSLFALGNTGEGGDLTRIADISDKEKQQRVVNHEILHTQGLSHKLIGNTGVIVNKKTFTSTIYYAIKANNLGIKIKGKKDKWLNYDNLPQRERAKAKVLSDLNFKKGKVKRKKK